MNTFLSICLALNLFTSSLISPTLSFIVSPNPFTNSSIHYEFSTSGEAANYYYLQCTSNSINYSDSDLLGMLCVLAKLYYEESSNIDSSLLSNIQSFFSTIRTSYSFYNRHILALYNALGYLVRSDSNYMNWLYNLLVNQEQWAQDPELHYFYYLYDNIEFTRTGLDLNPVLVDKLKEAASSTQSTPYTIYNIEFIGNYNWSSFVWANNDIKSSFINDLQSFASDHDYFSIQLFGSGLDIQVSHYNSSTGIYGYFFNAYSSSLDVKYYCPSGRFLTAVSSSFTIYSLNTKSNYDFLGKYLDSNNTLKAVLPTFNTVTPYAYRYLWSDYAFYQSLYFYSRSYSNNLDFAYHDSTWSIYPMIFSSKYDHIVVWDSTEDIVSYSLANGTYYKADYSSNSISYDTYNNYEGLYIANQTTYNSINNYIIDNSVSTIDNSTQTVINNYFNYDIEYNYSQTINNITNINEAEDSYLINFNQAFDNSGYSDYSFTSWTDSDGTSSSFTTSFSPVIALLDSFYLYLPSKLKMVIAGVLAVGLFGLILAVGVHLGRK